MCVASNVIDNTYDDWYKKYHPTQPPIEPYFPYIPMPMPTQEEINEFRELLKNARGLDKKNGDKEQDCEIEEKKKRFLKLAKELGIYKKVKEILDGKSDEHEF